MSRSRGNSPTRARAVRGLHSAARRAGHPPALFRQRDLLEVFQRLSQSNTILYTTHLASMVDPAFPERVRIVETTGNHSTVKCGVVSSQRAPMAVIDVSLGDLRIWASPSLGTRQTLIVEGGDDALILHKLSGILRAEGKPHLSDRIDPACAGRAEYFDVCGVCRRPGLGFRCAARTLDAEGEAARKKIQELTLKDLAEEESSSFHVRRLGRLPASKRPTLQSRICSVTSFISIASTTHSESRSTLRIYLPMA